MQNKFGQRNGALVKHLSMLVPMGTVHSAVAVLCSPFALAPLVFPMKMCAYYLRPEKSGKQICHVLGARASRLRKSDPRSRDLTVTGEYGEDQTKKAKISKITGKQVLHGAPNAILLPCPCPRCRPGGTWWDPLGPIRIQSFGENLKSFCIIATLDPWLFVAGSDHRFSKARIRSDKHSTCKQLFCCSFYLHHLHLINLYASLHYKENSHAKCNDQHRVANAYFNFRLCAGR